MNPLACVDNDSRGIFIIDDFGFPGRNLYGIYLNDILALGVLLGRDQKPNYGIKKPTYQASDNSTRQNVQKDLASSGQIRLLGVIYVHKVSSYEKQVKNIGCLDLGYVYRIVEKVAGYKSEF
jgi:hypothetical protein